MSPRRASARAGERPRGGRRCTTRAAATSGSVTGCAGTVRSGGRCGPIRASLVPGPIGSACSRRRSDVAVYYLPSGLVDDRLRGMRGPAIDVSWAEDPGHASSTRGPARPSARSGRLERGCRRNLAAADALPVRTGCWSWSPVGLPTQGPAPGSMRSRRTEDRRGSRTFLTSLATICRFAPAAPTPVSRGADAHGQPNEEAIP